MFANVALSNVPGPRESLYFGHSQIANRYSMGQIFDETPLNMTMWSYAGNVNLGILADRAIVHHIEAALGELAQGLPDAKG